jgi:hypothetical protein
VLVCLIGKLFGPLALCLACRLPSCWASLPLSEESCPSVVTIDLLASRRIPRATKRTWMSYKQLLVDARSSAPPMLSSIAHIIRNIPVALKARRHTHAWQLALGHSRHSSAAAWTSHTPAHVHAHPLPCMPFIHACRLCTGAQAQGVMCRAGTIHRKCCSVQNSFRFVGPVGPRLGLTIPTNHGYKRTH